MGIQRRQRPGERTGFEVKFPKTKAELEKWSEHFERMSPYERDQQRKHVIVEFGAWLMLASGVALLVISFFGGK